MIQTLFESGKNFYESPFKVFFLFSESDHSPLRAGFSVSKKKIKKATARNRIKRLMRESWRLNIVPIKNHLSENHLQLNVFLIFTGTTVPDYPVVLEKMKKVIEKLNTLLEKKLSANQLRSPETNQ